MRKVQELQAAIETAETAEEILALLNIWQGRIGDFWDKVARTATHWSDALLIGACGSAPVVLQSNQAVGQELIDQYTPWLVNRLFGDTLAEVRTNAFTALIDLAKNGKIDEESQGVAMIIALTLVAADSYGAILGAGRLRLKDPAEELLDLYTSVGFTLVKEGQRVKYCEREIV